MGLAPVILIQVKAEPIMLKNLPIILSRISQNFDPLFSNHHLLFLLIPVIFIVSVVIMSTIHMVTTVLENRMSSVQTFLQNLHKVLLLSCTSSP